MSIALPLAPCRPVRGERAGRTAQLAAALLLAAAGAVHAALVVPHAREHWAHGAFFALVAGAQLAGAAVLARSTGGATRARVADANAVVVVLWLVAKVAAPLFGVDSLAHGGIGVADVVCTTFEVLAIALLAVAGRAAGAAPAAARRAPGAGQRAALAALALVVLPLTAVTAAGAGSGGHAGHPAEEACQAAACPLDPHAFHAPTGHQAGSHSH